MQGQGYVCVCVKVVLILYRGVNGHEGLAQGY